MESHLRHFIGHGCLLYSYPYPFALDLPPGSRALLAVCCCNLVIAGSFPCSPFDSLRWCRTAPIHGLASSSELDYTIQLR
ncbi:unnamed protein product [Urochloa humidicola]